MIKHNLQQALWGSLFLLLGTSCGTVFEHGELCPDNIPPVPDEPVVYKIRFDDSRNMNFADAFSSEIKSLSLYVADSKSKEIVWTYDETDPAKLQSGSYELELPLEPGTYDFVTWCGLEQGLVDEVNRSFIPAYSDDVKKIEQLCVQLDGGINLPVDQALSELHNGILMEQTLADKSRTLVVPLTRNTNNVHIVLQRIDGTDLDASDFSFEIVADNGLMNYDNSLLADDDRHYIEYAKSNNASTSGGIAVVGELKTARMVYGHPMRLKAMHQGKTLLNIPLVTYALLVKGHYHEEMSEQEFLDRQNEWNFIFFLNDQNQWEQSNLYINDWHVILDDMNL